VPEVSNARGSGDGGGGAAYALDAESAAQLWDGVGNAVDRATLSLLLVEDRQAQPLIPLVLAPLALKALVGVFCGGIFTGLGVGKLGQRVGKEARELLAKLSRGAATRLEGDQAPDHLADEVTLEAERWVAQAREEAPGEDVVEGAVEAVAELLIARGEDPEQARATSRALARAVLDS
jgi:hypothetical protein